MDHQIWPHPVLGTYKYVVLTSNKKGLCRYVLGKHPEMRQVSWIIQEDSNHKGLCVREAGPSGSQKTKGLCILSWRGSCDNGES